MATRSRTKDFAGFRERCKRVGGNNAYSSPKKSREGLLGSDDLDSVSISIGLDHSLPPEWVDIVDAINNDLKTIKSDMKQLTSLHNKRLKVKFDDDESEQEMLIERKTQGITALLRKCEQNLKRIATAGNDSGAPLSQQEKMVRLNVMRNLANHLTTLSKEFRHKQKDFLMRVKGQEGIGNEFFDDAKDQVSFEDRLDRGLTAEEQEQLQLQHQNADQRHQEIIKIAQSINELATLFRELNVLVIEQGTILDRIDYNLEQTCEKVKTGTEELVKANEYSKKNKSMKCILFLSFIAIILFIILIAKHSGGGDSSESASTTTGR
mmetsp:Transcript_971/g.1277  ORF Transcript_971/g.1277 Transcript_971/m.1277 type:complete len:322 (-) Transcript_971:210-1175(-)|eukprot:CAMPEP_0175104210 /NCGR_PEP_ID=MMETSP0086_2-20121207/9574_1 /TAXON_ID=136419 /ORGANISM="Unknown Unknown, Strain D1" /LENGTH=321 /DNA_ID=CAMNT_0016379523 /DNA_START=55 /DNA_END=1020 /DNA_ORIENTATION=+